MCYTTLHSLHGSKIKGETQEGHTSYLPFVLNGNFYTKKKITSHENEHATNFSFKLSCCCLLHNCNYQMNL